MTVNKFLKYYEGFESRPVFESVEEMLKWAGLYNLTTITLGETLMEVGLSPILIQELVTVRSLLFAIYSFNTSPALFSFLVRVFCLSVVDSD